MTGRDVARLDTASAPEAYSFCASIMRRTESSVDAVDGGMPKMLRKEGEDMTDDYFGKARIYTRYPTFIELFMARYQSAPRH